MKAMRIAALGAVLVMAALPCLGLAQEHPKAAEHPKSAEHPKKAEHLKSAEHPKKGEHPKSAEHPAAEHPAAEHPAAEHPAAEHPAAAGDIVAVASGAGQFTTLVAALKAAGLVGTLQGEGPFTVFAPTDEAFAKLPTGAIDDLLKPENKSKLASILAYHVVSGKVMAADVKTMKVKTLNGEELSLKVEGQSVMADGAKIVKTDIAASNGVIHVIDKVVMPTAASGKPKDHPGHK